MKLAGENRRTRRKTCPSATLSTTNPKPVLVETRLKHFNNWIQTNYYYYYYYYRHHNRVRFYITNKRESLYWTGRNLLVWVNLIFFFDCLEDGGRKFHRRLDNKVQLTECHIGEGCNLYLKKAWKPINQKVQFVFLRTVWSCKCCYAGPQPPEGFCSTDSLWTRN
jgi:hypothetical protein